MIRRNDLTMEQIKEMKNGLRRSIHELTMRFQIETGVAVDIEKIDYRTIGWEEADWNFEINLKGRF
jgi:hypothetical protein